MATIPTSNTTSVLRIRKFLGINENPDGDTKIKEGEMSSMWNFRITQDGHLQIRPGTKTTFTLRTEWDTWCLENTPSTATPVFSGAWYGMVGASEHLLCAYGGVVWDVVSGDTWSATAVGECTQDTTTFFGFSGKVYLLNGHEYKSWDGSAETSFADVVGYVPITNTAMSPAGAGTLLENVNRLNGYRRVKYSPDGTATVFHLPEQSIDSVTSVTGTAITYTVDTTAGTLTFATAPVAGTNTITVTYKKGDGARTEVTAMHYSETFNGETDARVFLYGDGTNKTIYSGLDYDGNPTAEYFPDLYEMSVGESNTPITALCRHYARLLVYKPDSVYSAQYGTITLDDSSTAVGFYVTPVNRILGNEAVGQVQLVENNPLSLSGASVYQWKPTSTSGNITYDERTATRISDRVVGTMSTFDFAQTVTFNDRYNHEYWFLYNGTAAILNYANNTWYIFKSTPFVKMLSLDGEVYGFTSAGVIKRVSRDYRNDDGADIDAYAATGAMDFGKDWMLKYVPMVFVAIQPESNARISVTAESNKRSDYDDKVVSSSLMTFSHMSFEHFSFGTNRKPQVTRVKIKVKKATFYKLIFKSTSSSATATVLEADIQMRFAGNVK